MRMKKWILIVLAIFVIGGAIVIINFSPQLKIQEGIDEITVRNGTTGETLKVTDQQEINRIVDIINDLGLRKEGRVTPSTGWSIALDFKEENSQKTISFVLRNNGIEYKNDFYGTDDRVGVLLREFEDKFE